MPPAKYPLQVPELFDLRGELHAYARHRLFYVLDLGLGEGVRGLAARPHAPKSSSAKESADLPPRCLPRNIPFRSPSCSISVGNCTHMRGMYDCNLARRRERHALCPRWSRGRMLTWRADTLVLGDDLRAEQQQGRGDIEACEHHDSSCQ